MYAVSLFLQVTAEFSQFCKHVSVLFIHAGSFKLFMSAVELIIIILECSNLLNDKTI